MESSINKNYNRSRFLAFCSFALLLGALLVFVVSPEVSLTFAQWAAIFGGTFGISRIVSRETVCEPIRDASFRVGLEELITCPRCVGVWVSLGLLIGMVYLPSYAILVCGLFAIAGANIFLQEVMGILVRFTDTLDMKNLPYTTAPYYKGESKVKDD